MTVIAQIESTDEAASGFSPTLPPPLAVEASRVLQAEGLPLQPDVARLLYSLGMKGLHASVVDVESMACLWSWRVGDAGERGTTAEDDAMASVPTAMATIVHLKATPFDQTLTRQLDAQRWAFAWRVDAQRVVVAEAGFRLPNSQCTERDISAVRQLCSAGIEAGTLRRSEAVNDSFQRPAPDGYTSAMAPWAGVKLAPARWADSLAQRLSWPSLWALGLAGAVCWVAALQIGSSREVEARRFRQLSDATLSQQLARVLAAGDHGELQGSLDTFQGLGYFKGAVVVDTRHLAVARAGAVPALLIGQAAAVPGLSGARVVPLVAAAGNTAGQLLVWGLDMPSPGADAGVEKALLAAGRLLLLATLAGTVLLWRLRLHKPETGAQPPSLTPHRQDQRP